MGWNKMEIGGRTLGAIIFSWSLAGFFSFMLIGINATRGGGSPSSFDYSFGKEMIGLAIGLILLTITYPENK
jgi:hypothetical protein